MNVLSIQNCCLLETLNLIKIFARNLFLQIFRTRDMFLQNISSFFCLENTAHLFITCGKCRILRRLIHGVEFDVRFWLRSMRVI